MFNRFRTQLSKAGRDIVCSSKREPETKQRQPLSEEMDSKRHVYIYTYTYIGMYIYIYTVCMHACMHACMNACTHACTHACMYICMLICVCMYTVCMSICRYSAPTGDIRFSCVDRLCKVCTTTFWIHGAPCSEPHGAHVGNLVDV